MDVFTLLSYINKVSLVAFFITTLIVGYQIYVLKKEKTKEQTPSIPDFREKNNSNIVANFTSLPSSLTKKELKAVNYSKLVFLIISLLTIMVVIFVISLINKNNSIRNQASISPTIVVLPTATLRPKAILSPSPAVRQIAILSPSPTVTLSPSPTITLSPSPTVALSPSPTVALSTSSTIILSPPAISPPEALIVSSSPSPTEIVLAQTSITNSQLQTLPETGSIGKGLLIIGVAISTIFFSFWF